MMNRFVGLFALLLCFMSFAATANTDKQILTQINNQWNDTIIQASDMEVWGVEDYWATPKETLAKGKGDCEDIAIGKLFSAIEAGIDSSKLRLAVVNLIHHSGQKESHMVLAYYATPDSEPLYLDNTTSLIRPASQRSDLQEVVSIGFEGIFVGNSKHGEASQTKKWVSLLSRVNGS